MGNGKDYFCVGRNFFLHQWRIYSIISTVPRKRHSGWESDGVALVTEAGGEDRDEQVRECLRGSGPCG